jgi:hypothetical protein
VSIVLVVKPDEAQAEVLRRIFERRVGAELVIVQSTMAAVDEIAVRMPDLILLSTLLSPRDEDTLIKHLRSLEGASHLQTITIPQFRTSDPKPAAKKGGLFSKKSKVQAPVGCDPMAFAEDVVSHLQEASEIRNRPQLPKPAINVIAPAATPSVIENAPSSSANGFDTTPFQSAYAAPEPSNAQPVAAESVLEPYAAEPYVPDTYVPEPYVPEPYVPEPYVPEPYVSEPYVPDAELPRAPEPESEPEPVAPAAARIEEPAAPVRMKPRSIEIDEIDRLSKELGLNLQYVDDSAEPLASTPAPIDEGDVFDFGAALDRARNAASARRSVDLSQSELDAEAIREAAIAEAREAAEREAREAVAADLARVQAEAEAMREAAIAEAREAEAMREAAVAEAREAAERAAREKLDAELARIRAEAEVTVAEALNKVKLETEEAERLRAEEARLRAEESERLRAEEARLRAEEAERVRAEAEMARAEAERVRVEAQQAQQAFEAELARVRAEVEQSLAEQLETARKESERLRAAETAKARERAAAEAQLKAELDRLKFVATQTRKADESEARRATDQIKQLEGELARVHAQAEERQKAQLAELHAQMAEMREAAAQQARAAAAEALASARANAPAHDSMPRRLNVVRMQPRVASQDAAPREAAAREVQHVALDTQPAASPSTAGDYYSLFQPAGAPAQEEQPEEESASWREWTAWAADIDYRRHAKWALPVAACLLLVTNTNTGTAITTVARYVTPEEKPKMVVRPVNPDPFIEVVEQRVGSLKIESTPDGAEAILDGKSRGQTPLTILDVETGTHTLVLKSSAGTITRRVTIKNNQTTLLSEAIFSGWLAIFSPIPITVLVDGTPVSLTDDGRVMANPGKHVVELVSERFAYRATETLEVRPGETTPHTLHLPMGTVRVAAPEGAEIKIDGAAATGSASEGFSVAIGSHEISATHPSLGERRASVDVRHGEPAEVALRFEP